MDIDLAVLDGLERVPGWFSPLDQVLFAWILRRQRAGPPGDLAELGVYLGKSAILIGSHVRPGEHFTVCDLFETPAGEVANQEECNDTYPKLTRSAFEENYLAFHKQLPLIVQGSTEGVLEHVEARSCRFVHVDASHIYEYVARDVDSVRVMLRADGVAAFDDFRTEHTPGTAAAVWEGVFSKGLRPICYTRNKLYGTWGDPERIHDSLAEWLAGQAEILWDRHQVAGHRILRLWLARRPYTKFW